MVLSLVQAHAILHSQHRERDEQGRVVATLEDYARVFELVADKITRGADYAVSGTVRETVAAVAEMLAKDTKNRDLTISQIAHHLTGC